MGMAKSNFSNYINGRISISKAFLKKFYTAFGDEIKVLLSEDHGQQSDPIIELSKKNETLASKYDQLAESHDTIITKFHNLEEKLNSLLVEKLNKIERLISHLIDQKKNRSDDPSHKKPGE